MKERLTALRVRLESKYVWGDITPSHKEIIQIIMELAEIITEGDNNACED